MGAGLRAGRAFGPWAVVAADSPKAWGGRHRCCEMAATCTARWTLCCCCRPFSCLRCCRTRPSPGWPAATALPQAAIVRQHERWPLPAAASCLPGLACKVCAARSLRLRHRFGIYRRASVGECCRHHRPQWRRSIGDDVGHAISTVGRQRRIDLKTSSRLASIFPAFPALRKPWPFHTVFTARV